MQFAPIAYVDVFDAAGSLRQKMGLLADETPTSVNNALLKKWAEMRMLLQKIKRIGDGMGGVEFGKIALEELAAGSWRDWATRPGDDGWRWALLALRTNPGVMHYSAPESIHLVPGHIVVVNPLAPFSAVNMGETPAVWLSMLFKVKTQ